MEEYVFLFRSVMNTAWPGTPHRGKSGWSLDKPSHGSLEKKRNTAILWWYHGNKWCLHGSLRYYVVRSWYMMLQRDVNWDVYALDQNSCLVATEGKWVCFSPWRKDSFLLENSISLQETNVWPQLSKLFPLISFAFLFFFHERKKKIILTKTVREKGGKHLVIIRI